jgi:hypothetical protein
MESLGGLTWPLALGGEASFSVTGSRPTSQSGPLRIDRLHILPDAPRLLAAASASNRSRPRRCGASYPSNDTDLAIFNNVKAVVSPRPESACAKGTKFIQCGAMSQELRFKQSSRVFCAGITVATLLLSAGPALAAKKPSPETPAPSLQAREKAARKACLAGDFAKGVDILADLFVETRDANHLYNQGRCFEQNRHYEDAIARFQEYLGAAGAKLTSEEKEAAEQHMRSSKESLAQERGGASLQPAPQAVTAPPPPVAAASEPAGSPVIVQSAAPPVSNSDGRGLRIGGIVAASAGVAAVGTAVVLNLKANSMVDDMYSTLDGYSKESERKNYETGAWIGYGVGAACVVTGVVLYTLGHRAKSRSTSNVALVPSMGFHHAGASLLGAF